MKHWWFLISLVAACRGEASSLPDGSTTSDGNSGGGDAGGPPADAALPRPVDFEWAAWRVPPDSPPASQYQVSNGIVLDTVTGLEWRQVPGEDRFFWASTNDFCSQLDLGGTGWRLPTMIELTSIVDHGAFNTSINEATFPGTHGEDYWTSSRSSYDASQRWTLYFWFGYSAHIDDDSQRFARCVRSRNTAVAGSVGAPAGRYTTASDVVTDNETGLRWQRASSATTMQWSAASAYCQGLDLGGASDWRLPTIKELVTLVDVRGLNPAIDETAFPSTASGFYFASTAYATSSTEHWIVNFGDGTSYHGTVAHTRCVR